MNFDYFKQNLDKEELTLVDNGKKYWKEKILKNTKDRRVKKEDLFFLIDCIIENSMSNAKEFYNDNEEKSKIIKDFLTWRLKKPHSDFQTSDYDIEEFLKGND